MSIAVSVMVVPSRLLRVLAGAMSCLLAALGISLCAGLIVGVSVEARIGTALFSFFPALFGLYHSVRNRKALHIDISSTGQIRIKETSATSRRKGRPPHGTLVRLLPYSTLWPHMLLLRLQADDGERWTVPILMDCVSRNEFRALSVACRWIAAHNDSADHKKSAQIR